MHINALYKITKGSDDGTLVVGDRVKIDDELCLLCVSAGGWIEKGDVMTVMKGAEYEIDSEWVAKEIEKSESRLAWLGTLSA